MRWPRSAAGSTRNTTGSPSTASPSPSGPGSSTTCSTSRPRSSPPPATPRAARRWSTWCPAEPRVFPVGRLDWDTEGLLLLTNDGDLAHGLTHPSRGVPKTYLAEVTGVPGTGGLRRLRDGVDLDDGRTAPARVRVAQTTPTGAAVEIVIHEGRNRQVRRMCEAVGHPVRRLIRTRFGPLTRPPARSGPMAAACIRRKFARCTPLSNLITTTPKRTMRFEISLVAQECHHCVNLDRFVYG